ncbi:MULTISPECIES: hypothetical protein [Mammaliicoccus]|uniref:Uncharacterized protein n=2 Tax=Mammaliicoccus sciuri TaxID=1296 RepID=A0AB37HRA2_MAMSC|nr:MULTISPECIES: hypothetical protein [Mammaliicoccus]RXY84373.1 hypothetical protein DD607_33560 [Salmonella sp. 3DZ2-4SM]ARB41136.1 hypothetical protein B5728_11135 [Mammaliicoccus sciuri]MCE4980130.1 hypothetical protein [Mammaliicoccus sciuri]MCE5039543.1 hypothetical protein [Mammaliicoccus sciuri]MCE5058140.1 hypothetical protein [Mammaliicoccus sciuri]
MVNLANMNQRLKLLLSLNIFDWLPHPTFVLIQNNEEQWMVSFEEDSIHICRAEAQLPHFHRYYFGQDNRLIKNAQFHIKFKVKEELSLDERKFVSDFMQPTSKKENPILFIQSDTPYTQEWVDYLTYLLSASYEVLENLYNNNHELAPITHKHVQIPAYLLNSEDKFIGTISYATLIR